MSRWPWIAWRLGMYAPRSGAPHREDVDVVWKLDDEGPPRRTPDPSRRSLP